MASGDDGASVMLGNRGGVSTLLKKKAPFLVANHCVAHQLALASSQAANEIPYLKRFKDVLDQLFRYYQNSPVHMSGLKSMQDIPFVKTNSSKGRTLAFT